MSQKAHDEMENYIMGAYWRLLDALKNLHHAKRLAIDLDKKGIFDTLDEVTDRVENAIWKMKENYTIREMLKVKEDEH